MTSDRLAIPLSGEWSRWVALEASGESSASPAMIRARVEEGEWLAVAFRPVAGHPLPPGEVALLVDPVGDLEAFFEITLSLPDREEGGSVFRRNRSGYRRDLRWRCEGLESVLRPHAEGLEIRFPKGALGTTAWHPGWRGSVRYQIAGSGATAFWAGPEGHRLYDPLRFGTFAFEAPFPP